MIIGIDHLAFGSHPLHDDLAGFCRLGYQAAFVETALDDLPNKQRLMHRFSGRLQMALLRHPDGLGIELVDHGHVTPGTSFLHPVFEGVPLDAEADEHPLEILGRRFLKVRSGLSGAEFFVPDEPVTTQFRCNQLIVDAADLDRAADFWQHFGFRQIAREPGAMQLGFRSLLGGGSCVMNLHQHRGATPRYVLDSRGFNCIAFVSSDPARDRVKFERTGLRMTEPNRFHAGGKELTIFWIEGPAGEIVEIIGLKRDPAAAAPPSA